MDPHVLYPPDYIPRLVAGLQESSADNVGGVLVTVPADGSPTAQAIAIQHATIRDDDDAIEDLLIALIVQARQAVREPRDAVGLATSRRVLDQVVAARSLLP